ncbi:zinc-binding dehydrogenase [Galbitalea soli]|uniref:Zinc-binding dehydrogenase n=1 Tax=Galbitalea soli TaxID=1268042 RepID=A0A7C9PMN9_9MICO|nr:zinc-binding dehydrogenase [Galbitalea soli]NEM91113.1 zinc-binding dehydrogenase [Galbitalea soli]NYJ29802.1 NADPH:quinone reductase-like Zn-dependent oxidoreductase/predicted SnoaL-like aldol condensation-catalyzing enzyme [Galbitalea soli]
MRAISQDTFGGPDVLKVVDLPTPSPGVSEILVAVHAAGLNPTDWGNRARGFSVQTPVTLGWDVSGVVEAVGFGVTLFKPGDEVFGMLPYPGGVGSHAEYVTGPARAFALKPSAIDHVEAGALPLAALTAYQALVETADLRPGQRVLIHAAAGGVGHLAVQIAKSRGAYVIGTASASKHDLLRSLGADEVIDYQSVDFAEVVRGVDVVLDSISSDAAGRARSLAVLRPGGTLVSLIPVPIDATELHAIAERGIRFEALLVEADHAGMQAIADLAESGELRPHIAATFPLAEAARAHALGESRRTAGKIVLEVREGGSAERARRMLSDAFIGDTAIVDRIVRSDYIQHNPQAPDGPDALKYFGAGLRQQFPEVTNLPKRAIAEGDMVLLHSHVVFVPGTPGTAVFDIFRFQDGKIAEHWDVLQEVPATTVNGNDMFATLSAPRTSSPQQPWFTDFNKRVVDAFFGRLMVNKDLSAIDQYVDPDYRQHNPRIADGAVGVRAGLREYFERFPQLSIVPKRTIAQGDLVAVHSHYIPEPGDRGKAVVDLFRVRNGKLVEHWDAVQDIPEAAANDNTMF